MFAAADRPRTGIWKTLPIAMLAIVGIAILFYLGLRPKEKQEAELTGILRAGDPTYEWYSQYVDLKKPKIQMAKNHAGKRMVIFSGVIENNGEKTLDVVEVGVHLFNHDELVWETTRRPIRPGAYTPPLAPLKQCAFTLYVETIPSKWRASNAEIAVRGFRFQQRGGSAVAPPGSRRLRLGRVTQTAAGTPRGRQLSKPLQDPDYGRKPALGGSSRRHDECG